jgi:MFS transporter, ACS family, tartrate transporter
MATPQLPTYTGTPESASLAESTTLRKLRVRILPFVFVLYVVSFLDRINIGFAALTMNKDLGVTSQQFGFLAGIFFFGYFIFEIPSNLLLHKFGARVWLTRIIITWGCLAFLTGFVHSVTQLYVLRFLLGLAEAGYFPGIVLYLTYWFRQREQAQAIALFLTGLPFTSILGAPLSGFILDRVHWFGISSWRWLLSLEAIPAILCGILTYIFLPTRPAEAKFLTASESAWLAGELAREERQKQAAHPISARQALANARVWHIACIGIFLNIAMYTLSFWLPQVVKALAADHSNSFVGLLVMIPYLAGLLAMIVVSRSSDRRAERKFHAAIPALLAATALVSMYAVHSTLPSMVLLCLAAIGIYSVYGPLYALPSEFLCGFAAASGIALISSVANLGGFVGPFLVGIIRQRTGSLHAGLAFTGVSVFVSATLMLLLPRKPNPTSQS